MHLHRNPGAVLFLKADKNTQGTQTLPCVFLAYPKGFEPSTFRVGV